MGLVTIDTDLSNCTSSGIFGKVIVYFSHCSFYGIHHLLNNKATLYYLVILQINLLLKNLFMLTVGHTET